MNGARLGAFVPGQPVSSMVVGMQTFQDALLQAIRERPAGEPVLAAFSRFVLEPGGLLAAAEAGAAEELGPWIAANALMGVHRALVAYVRRRILAGDDSLPDLARDVRSFGESAFALLAGGLGGYARKPPAAEGHR